MKGRPEELGGDLDTLRAFAAIVDAGSLSGAARRLGTSLTYMSRRLTTLERLVDARLVDRTSQRLQLTDEGVVFHERIVEVLRSADGALAEVASLRGRVAGRLRVSAPHEIGRREIVGLCGRFARAHPDVRMELSLNDARPDMLRDRFDVVLTTKRPVADEVIQRRLLCSRRVICAAPSYLATRGEPRTPAELAEHDCLVLRRGGKIYDEWSLLVDGRKSAVRVPVALVANNTDAIHSWVLEGAGIAVKALWDIEAELADGRLQEVLADAHCDEICLYAAYSSRMHVPLRIRTFIDYLAKHIDAHFAAQGHA